MPHAWLLFKKENVGQFWPSVLWNMRVPPSNYTQTFHGLHYRSADVSSRYCLCWKAMVSPTDGNSHLPCWPLKMVDLQICIPMRICHLFAPLGTYHRQTSRIGNRRSHRLPRHQISNHAINTWRISSRTLPDRLLTVVTLLETEVSVWTSFIISSGSNDTSEWLRFSFGLPPYWCFTLDGLVVSPPPLFPLFPTFLPASPSNCNNSLSLRTDILTYLSYLRAILLFGVVYTTQTLYLFHRFTLFSCPHRGVLVPWFILYNVGNLFYPFVLWVFFGQGEKAAPVLSS